MYKIHAYDTPTGRIDPDHREHSPSTGTDETAEILHAPRAHAVEEDPHPDGDAVDLEDDKTMVRDSSPRLEVAQ